MRPPPRHTGQRHTWPGSRGAGTRGKVRAPARAVPATPAVPKAELIDVDNVSGLKALAIHKRITRIGRDPDNDLVIPLETVSGLHALIEYRDGFFLLEDQRSTNRTYLGGEAVAPHSPKRLKSGDEIRFNGCAFVFLLEQQLPSGDTGERGESVPPSGEASDP